MIKRNGTAEDNITNNPDCLVHESKKLDEDKHKLLEKMPDPEVAEVRRRRRFSVKYKLRILEKADRCTGPGEIGALLRRDGLFSSYLQKWRQQREEGALSGLQPKKRGVKPRVVHPLERRVTALEKEKANLQSKLHKAQTVIEFQKKISEILGISMDTEMNAENT